VGTRIAKQVPARTFAADVPSLTRPNERRLQWVSFCAALLIHMLVLLVSFPEIRRQAPPPRQHTPIVVKRYVPPPPKVERRQTMARTRHTRKIPIPDPTPDLPEPITEPAPAIALEAPWGDVDVMIGDPAPPGPDADAGYGEPLLAGVGGTSLPVRIDESYVQPEYPEIARIARIEGNVVLQAIIDREGTVDDIEVLRCTRPAFGFEDAAIAAVRQWRYEPATQDGRPVTVYFTILVDFTLL
jgi:protein TonB